MSPFVIHKPSDFEATVKNVVRQSFPFATPSTLVLNATEREMRSHGDMTSLTVPGGKQEWFIWGVSRMEGSRIVKY